MKKGLVELGENEEEGESESKVTNQIFGRLQHPKNGVRYLETFNGFTTFTAFTASTASTAITAFTA